MRRTCCAQAPARSHAVAGPRPSEHFPVYNKATKGEVEASEKPENASGHTRGPFAQRAPPRKPWPTRVPNVASPILPAVLGAALKASLRAHEYTNGKRELENPAINPGSACPATRRNARETARFNDGEIGPERRTPGQAGPCGAYSLPLRAAGAPLSRLCPRRRLRALSSGFEKTLGLTATYLAGRSCMQMTRRRPWRA